MFGFEEQHSKDLPGIIRAFGVSVSYQSIAGGEPVIVYALIDHDINLVPRDYENQLTEIGTVITLISDEIPETKRGDTITHGSSVYTAQYIETDDRFVRRIVVT